MSFTVDDLVSSLSTNHIGQEAIDLAALQVELSQSLFTSTQSNPLSTKKEYGHCNTPMAFSPTSGSSWSERGSGGSFAPNRSRSSSNADRHRPRQNSIDEIGGFYYNSDIDESDEDEQMVEDILFPSSPISSAPPSATSSHFRQPTYGSSGYPSTPSSPTMQCDNHFTTTDPFYLEQLRQQQSKTPLISPPIFSQYSRTAPTAFSHPSGQSQYHYVHHQQFPYEVDQRPRAHTHAFFVGAVNY